MEWFVADMKPTDWIVAFAALAACVGVAVVLIQLNCLARQVEHGETPAEGRRS